MSSHIPPETPLKRSLKNRHWRALWLVAIVALAAALAYGLVQVFNNNLVFFYTPSQIKQGQYPTTDTKPIRLGGMVVKGSLQQDSTTLKVRFDVTDNTHTVPVEFTGLLPDLFKEGSGMVADGRWTGNTFVASEVLAKHDENYMPPGVKP